MGYVNLYRITHLTPHHKNTILFNTQTERETWFSSFPIKLTGGEVKELENPWNMTNEITIYSTGLNTLSNYNYLQYKDKDDNYFYFYIIDAYQQTQSSVRLRIQLDTLMSFSFPEFSGGIRPVDYTIGKSIILKEHKNRFTSNGSYIIDRTIEDFSINPSIMEQVDTAFNEDTVKAGRVRLALKQVPSGSTVKYIWIVYTEFPYLVRQIAGLPTPDMELGMVFGPGNTTIQAGKSKLTFSVPAGQYAGLHSGGIMIKYNANTGAQINEDSTTWATITNNEDGYYKRMGRGVQFAKWRTATYTIYESNAEVYTGLKLTNGVGQPLSNLTLYGEIAQDQTVYGKTFEDLDLTDVSNSKIVELPYLPEASLKYHSTHGFYYDANDDMMVKLEFEVPQLYFDTSKVLRTSKVDYNDPKLYHSQFNPRFITWQGEVIPYRMEAYKTNPTELKLNVKYSNDKNSAFFEIEQHANYTYNEINETQKNVQLNNNVSRLNSDLDTYLRYQQEDDDRTRNIVEKQAARNSAISITNQAMSAIPMNKLDASNATQVGMRTARSALNIGNELKNAQENKELRSIQQKQKMTALAIGTINISGNTPELNYVNDGDKIKMYEGRLEGYETLYIEEIFHREGYTTLEYKRPVLHTRTYWDYKKMITEPIAGRPELVTNEILMDVQNRLAEGITFFHPVGSNPLGSINWNKSYENWELIL